MWAADALFLCGSWASLTTCKKQLTYLIDSFLLLSNTNQESCTSDTLSCARFFLYKFLASNRPRTAIRHKSVEELAWTFVKNWCNKRLQFLVQVSFARARGISKIQFEPSSLSGDALQNQSVAFTFVTALLQFRPNLLYLLNDVT